MSKRSVNNRKRLSTADAKVEFLKLYANGLTPARALQTLGYSRSSFNNWLARDVEFASRVADLDSSGLAPEINVNSVVDVDGRVEREDGVVINPPSFDEWHRDVFGYGLDWHQLQWDDVLCNRPPRDLHPSQDFVIPDSYNTPDIYGNFRPMNRFIINTPVMHAKSTTLTVRRTVYKICMNWNVRIGIISETSDLATKFLGAITEYLVSPDYKHMQEKWGPVGGFKGDTLWRQDEIIINGRTRTLPDPTVATFGLGTALYGRRFDFVACDDIVSSLNHAAFAAQLNYLNDMVYTRLEGEDAQMLIVGSRQAVNDVYSHALNKDNYSGQQTPYIYFRSPAVLEYDDDPKDWVCLWPRTQVRPVGAPVSADGFYPMNDGLKLNEAKSGMSEGSWSRIYQQEQVSPDTVFKVEDVRACMDSRGTGVASLNSVRPGGIQGLAIIASVDPAATGYSAGVVYGVDLVTRQRWVIDIFNKKSMMPEELRGIIKEWTELYHPYEWRIESNAFQKFLAMDPELVSFTAGLGSKIVPHLTHRNKHDPVWGVKGMSSLFVGKMIHLPDARSGEMRTLQEQLTNWTDDESQKRRVDDIVMALWFAELRALEMVRVRDAVTNDYINTPFQTRGDIARRTYVSSGSFNGIM